MDDLAAIISDWLVEESPEVWSRPTDEIGRGLAAAIAPRLTPTDEMTEFLRRFVPSAAWELHRHNRHHSAPQNKAVSDLVNDGCQHPDCVDARRLVDALAAPRLTPDREALEEARKSLDNGAQEAAFYGGDVTLTLDAANVILDAIDALLAASQPVPTEPLTELDAARLLNEALDMAVPTEPEEADRMTADERHYASGRCGGPEGCERCQRYLASAPVPTDAPGLREALVTALHDAEARYRSAPALPDETYHHGRMVAYIDALEAFDRAALAASQPRPTEPEEADHGR